MPSKKPTVAQALPTVLPELKTPGLVPTAYLRWVRRPIDGMTAQLFLEQYFDVPVADYMRSAKKTGEWRIVETVEE